ncbi:CoA transferase [Ramlibacter sp. USB13]|uniref:CoA transferase n=1 Tax=Ramlibacter cellulosilyticus TaxID=2764187 RepID=A0A923MTW9_9BURK|nr:CoA transferase [Ramlibacter cellulosilyticus]
MPTAREALSHLWRLAGLPAEALSFAHLPGTDPVYPSSFRVATAAQTTIAAAALAACELGHLRGTPRQSVTVDATHAAAECLAWFSIDGRVPELWDKFSGLYRTRDGWVRVHANFAHHREGALRLLGLDPATADRPAAEAAMLGWDAVAFETAAAEAGLVATALRSFAAWDATGQGRAIAAQPLFTLTRIGDAPPRRLADLHEHDRPLAGVRVLDLTRILAGPVGGRALAAYGADVMLVNAPHLPNIEAIADTSRGKRSALVDLRTDAGRATLDMLLETAHVFVQGYRPGGLASLGFGPEALARRRPGIVAVSLSAYGTQGPWRDRRGFDSLVQTATGFNAAEAEAAGVPAKPRALPMQILDEATGYLIAFGAAAALHRQQREGGSWHVEVSLAQTGHWLRQLGRVPGGLSVTPPDLEPFCETSPSAWGALRAPRHAAQLGRTPAAWSRPSERPGDSPARW